MSFSPWKKRSQGVGAPIFPLPAGDFVQKMDEGKNHFEKSAQNAETPRPKIELASSEKIVRVTEIHPGDPVKEDQMGWQPRKRPHGRGYKNNKPEVDAVMKDIENSLPNPPALPEVRSVWRTKEYADGLVEFISSGGSINQYCKRTGTYPARVTQLMHEDPAFKARIMQAREVGYDAMAEEALRIASEPFFQNEEIISYDKDGNVISRAVKRFDAVYARKLAFQARLQLLAKWAPNKYGEKPVIDTNESRASKILEARRRIASASELTENRHDLTD